MKILLTNLNNIKSYAIQKWQRIWMRFAGPTRIGRLACWFASFFSPPHYAREQLAHVRGRPYVALKSTIHHKYLKLNKSVFIDDYVMIYGNKNGGRVDIGKSTRIYRYTTIETGDNGKVIIGEYSSIHPRCQINAYCADIQIGNHVMIAANCAFYSYDHGSKADIPIRNQPISSKGPIIIEDEAWIGTGSIILSGVIIGEGAIVAAGSVVTRSVPASCIVAGNPAKIIKSRS